MVAVVRVRVRVRVRVMIACGSGCREFESFAVRRVRREREFTVLGHQKCANPKSRNLISALRIK